MEETIDARPVWEQNLLDGLSTAAERDDAAGAVAAMERAQAEREAGAGGRDWRPWAIEIAIDADAAEMFAALVASDAASGGPGFGRRLSGGEASGHRCCRLGLRRGGSPKCMAKVAAAGAAALLLVDDAGRTVLDAAAACPDDGKIYALAISGLERDVEAGRLGRKKAASAAGRSLFKAAEAIGDPLAFMGRLEAALALGVDWRSVVDKQGASLFGACVKFGSESAGMAMLAAGADPLAACVPPLAINWGGPDQASGPAVAAMLDFAHRGWLRKPLLARAMLAALGDADFKAVAERFYARDEGYARATAEDRACQNVALANGEPHRRDATLARFEAEFKVPLAGRLASLREALALDAVARKLKDGRAEGSKSL